MWQLQAHRVLDRCLSELRGMAAIQLQGISALRNLCSGSEGRKDEMLRTSVVHKMSRILQTHRKGDGRVIEACMKLLVALSGYAPPPAQDTSVSSKVNNATARCKTLMTNHRAHVLALTCLELDLVRNPKSEWSQQQPAGRLPAQSVSPSSMGAAIAQAAVGVLRNLIDGKAGGISQRKDVLMRLGTHWKLTALLNIYVHDANVVVVATDVLLKLCSGTDRLAPVRQDAIVVCGAAGVIADVQRKFPYHRNIRELSQQCLRLLEPASARVESRKGAIALSDVVDTSDLEGWFEAGASDLLTQLMMDPADEAASEITLKPGENQAEGEGADSSALCPIM